MPLISVDRKQCIKCGICVDVCPVRVLELGEKGPEAMIPEACNACGHCVAVCPKGAIDHLKAPLSEQSAIENNTKIDALALKQFLRSRRSIRCYKQESVPREKLLQLIEVARYAPTASNRQGVSYIIVEDKKIIEQATAFTVQWMEEEIKNTAQCHWSFSHHVRAYKEKGIDTVLRSAPNLILAVADKELAKGRENTIFSLTYLELFAKASGLGSCWAGLLEMCLFTGYAPLVNLFQIPADKKITGAVMVGFPKYQYQRLVERNPLEFSLL